MYKSIILIQARDDIKEAAQWYNMRSAGLGKKFTSDVFKKVSSIVENPNAISIRYDEVRTIVLDKLPYMIHYTIDENNKLVIVSSVLHTSRSSKLWRNR